MTAIFIAVQLPLTGSTDFDALIHIEDMLKAVFLSDQATTVGGHDLGSGKFTVHLSSTAAVSAVVDRAKAALDQFGVLQDAVIAHSTSPYSDYSVVWPEQFGGSFSL